METVIRRFISLYDPSYHSRGSTPSLSSASTPNTLLVHPAQGLLVYETFQASTPRANSRRANERFLPNPAS